MTVSNNIRRSGPYLGNGVATDFPYEFRILDAAHLRVVRRAVDGTETTLTLDTDYTVSGVGDDAGGTVSLVAPVGEGETLTIIRNMPLTQGIDLENQGEYYAETVERGLDALTMGVQQLREELDRSVKVPVSGDIIEVDELMANVRTIAAMADEVDAVAGGIGEVSIVADHVSEVSAAAANMNAITTVAANGTEVAAVADALPDLAAIASAMPAVTLAASKLPEIEAAPAAAEAAAEAAAAAQGVVDTAMLGSVPVGTLIWFSAPTPPAGYLLANGNGVTPVYPQLRQLYLDAGSPYGTDGNGNPRLPDFVSDGGRFVRGHDAAGARVFGSYQADALKAHVHNYDRFAGSKTYPSAGDSSSSGPTGTTPTATSLIGEEETRPKNISQLPCIKAGDGVTNSGFVDVSEVANRVDAIDLALTTSLQIMHIQDQKSAGAHGGSFIQGGERIRELNTVITNTIDEAHLSNNRIALPPGIYEIDARCTAFRVRLHRLKVYNATSGIYIITGTPHYSDATGFESDSQIVGDSNPAEARGVFSLQEQSFIEIHHRCSITRNTYGFGMAANFGDNEVFSDIIIHRIL
ncbi:hypothetical protein GCM10007276_34280 [Agaricicola taiwanensis]|uniref:Phage tail collar domain-containing protein n=1 Tax=Agaricicola taiwanensis TaxID=591372 RepID=A0A8J2YM47_9RHOB|nr:tail fiber protein [Agaricicola taiwanensis]GGE54343.1 hypothetical protein GCM10007276_34280 [Agaricicola taiwanensis]